MNTFCKKGKQGYSDWSWHPSEGRDTAAGEGRKVRNEEGKGKQAQGMKDSV